MERNNVERNNKTGIAVILILVGCLILGFNYGIIPYALKSIFISWQMFLIALGVVALIRKNYTTAGVLILIGVFFILPTISRIFPWFLGGIHLSFRNFWPVIFILIGLLIIFRRPKSKRRSTGHFNNNADSDKVFFEESGQPNAGNHNNMIDENVIFGGSERIIFSDQFQGGDLNVLFGEIKIDLRKSTLSYFNDNRLEANAMFGSIILYIPNHWKVNMKKESLFAGIQDKRTNFTGETDPNAPVLNIKASSIFGSIEIRN